MEYNLTPDEILNEIDKIRKERNLPKDERVKELSKFEIDNLPTIPDNWKWVIINDISEFITNGVHTPTSTEDDNGFGLHCLRITDLKENGNIDYANLPYCLRIVEGDYDKKLKKDDIYFSFTGNNLGKRYIVKETREDTVFAHYFVRWHPILVDPYYIYYVTHSKIYDYFITANKHGSTQPNLKVMDLKRFPIPLCDLNIQRKISKILKNIDEKIELNNKTNDNLFELGDTLYKEFYSQYENRLPNGYKYLNLNEVSVNFDAKRKPMSSREREQHKGKYPYYGATSIIDYVDDYIFNDTYLLMGEDGTVKTSEGYPVLQYIWGKNWINNHAHVLQGTIISTEHLMFALRKKNIEALITGAVQPKINQVNMNKIKVIIGTDEINKRFEDEIKVIVAKIKENIIENEILEQLRDTLLPKLMNGEIDLDKIEIKSDKL